MLPQWEDAEEQPAWPDEARAWYSRQLDARLRTFLFEQPALLEALGVASPVRGDPYRDALLRVTDWYLEHPPLVIWQDDELYRPETLSGGYKILWGAVRDALLRAVRDVLAEIEAESAAAEQQDQQHTGAMLRAEQRGTLPPAPVEPSRAVLLARARGSWGERGEP
jgi:hypothetical protein